MSWAYTCTDLPLDYFQTLPEKIAAVTVADVAGVCPQAHLNPDKLSMSWWANKNAVSPGLKDLALRPGQVPADPRVTRLRRSSRGGATTRPPSTCAWHSSGDRKDIDSKKPPSHDSPPNKGVSMRTRMLEILAGWGLADHSRLQGGWRLI